MSLQIIESNDGRKSREIVAREEPEAVIVDMQIGSMGGVAVCMDLRLEESGGRLPATKILIVVDRRADVFLARRSGADGYLVRPMNPIRLRQALKSILEGNRFHDDTDRPYERALTNDDNEL
jgi:DNA-binding response OmpR family regulator